jgi:hypothetical protein
MQSSRRAWSPRLSATLSIGFVVCVISPPGRAQSEPAAPTAPAPHVQYELDPTKAFGDRVIVLVRTPGDDGVMMRLRADLRESEWRILEIRPDERFESPPLGASAERERASAAVRVDRQRGTIELWVLRPEGPVEETIATHGAPEDEQVMALRVAEVLRARGILLKRSQNGSATTAPEPANRKQVTSVTDSPTPRTPERPESRKRLWLELGPGLALSPGGLGPFPLVELGVRLELSEDWSVCLNGFVPLSPQTVAAAEGEAEVASTLVSGTLELDWFRSSSVELRSGMGAGVTVTTMAGKARPDFRAAEDTVTTFAPLLRSSLHVSIGRWLRLRSGVVVGATFPEVRVAFASHEVASWGRPFVLASVALEASPIAW